MTERQEAYTVDYDTPAPGALWVMRLTVDERRLIMRVREARANGQQLLIDPDSMTWRGLGKLENVRRR